MGKFLNNLKRAFTAPKTRHMKKKINSMKDYMGFTKKFFEQMKQDAEFFKSCEEKFHDAIRNLWVPLLEERLVERDYRLAARFLCGGEKNIFQQIYDHKINWYYMEDKDIQNFANTTNKKLSEFQGEYNSNDSIKESVQTMSDDLQQNSVNFDKNKLKPFIKFLKSHRDFCRETKQEIKKFFETKQKEFEKSAEENLTVFSRLELLTNQFETNLNEKKFKDALNSLKEIINWYNTQKSSSSNLDEKVILKNYTIVNKYVSDSIKKEISNPFNDIIKKLDSIKSYDGLDHEKHKELEDQYFKLIKTINSLLEIENNILTSIGTSKTNINLIKINIKDIVEPFLYKTTETKTFDKQTINNQITTVENILNQWKL